MKDLKRKAPAQPLEPVGKRLKVVGATVDKDDDLRGDVPSRSPGIHQLSEEIFQNLQRPDKCASDVEEIDSFTVTMSDAPKTSNPEFGKRKYVPTELRQSPRKRKHLPGLSNSPQPNPASSAADLSPCVVFHLSKLRALNYEVAYLLFRRG
jgi:hypothetical protein